MKATCIRDCTAPGHGMVAVGKVIEVPDGATVEDLPYLKHFKLEGVVQAADPEKPKPATNPEKPAKLKADKPKAKSEDFLN